jgi:hypothetical protein
MPVTVLALTSAPAVSGIPAGAAAKTIPWRTGPALLAPNGSVIRLSEISRSTLEWLTWIPNRGDSIVFATIALRFDSSE